MFHIVTPLFKVTSIVTGYPVRFSNCGILKFLVKLEASLVKVNVKVISEEMKCVLSNEIEESR